MNEQNNTVLHFPRLVNFSSIGDSTLGFITIGEANKNVPFEIKRVYWTYFTPNNVRRGGHAHKQLEQIVFAVCGRLEFHVENVEGITETFVLDSPDVGLYIPKMIWREIKFSHNAVLLCLASEVFYEGDYIRNYSVFKNHVGI